MALALYRKYRPRTFAEVIGQEHVTEPLSQALRTGRLHHAYLFSGPRGCGKTSSARILARSLNCEQGPTPEPCGKCDSCIALAPDGSGSIDVIEIDAASHGGVDDARDLRERAFFAPVASRFKVYVIDEAHMVSSAGFNALLKLVEEPPEYVKFVFATTEPEKVLGTIKSRTHHYPFRLIPPGVLRPYLEQLTSAEGVKVEPAVFPLVVRAGGGSARDTLSVLDQLIAGAGPEGVSYSRAVALLGVTDVALIDEMCDALAASDGAGAYGVIDRVVEAGHDPRRFASDLLERLRDLIILQQVPDAVTKGLLDAPEDQLERMTSEAAHLGSATLSRFADIVHNGLTEMRGTTAPRLLLELICARMLLPGVDDSTGALLQRLERMERRLTAGGEVLAAPVAHLASAPTAASSLPESAPTAASLGGAGSSNEASLVEAASSGTAAVPRPDVGDHAAAPAESAPAESAQADDVAPDPKSSTQPGALDAVAVRRVWDEVLAIVSRKSKRAAAVVREATVREVDGETLVLVFRHSVHADMLSKSPEILVEALYELLGGRWVLRCEVGSGPAGPAGGSRLQSPPARPPTDPPLPRAAPAEAANASTATTSPSGAPTTSGGRRTASTTSEDWPTPAQPGGPAAHQPRENWPTPAQPGGQAAHQPAGDWPAPAQSGGSGGQRAAQAGEQRAAQADDWPTPALVGGQAAHAGGQAAHPGGQAAHAGAQAAHAGAQAAHAGGQAAHPGGQAAHAGAQAAHAGGQAAHPGGQAAHAGVSAARAASATQGHDGGDWPAPAPLGASTTASEQVPEGRSKQAPATGTAGRGAGSSFAAPARDSSGSTGASGSIAAPSPRRSAAAEQARAAASRAGSTQRSGAGQRGSNQRGGAQRPGSGQRSGGSSGRAGSGSGSAWDGTAADEPPYDPEYDGPPADDPKAAGDQRHVAADQRLVAGDQRQVAGEATYPGFDPGDEPLDDADPGAARESTEEVALRLLSEALGAEKIGETGG